MKALIIGGTRNLGPSLVAALLEAGYQVAVFNRGVTPGELPSGIARLRGDRSDAAQLAAAVKGREFDLVVDTTLYNGPDAVAVARIFKDRVGRYIFLSTGQVYLVRQGLQRPYKEDDYAGPVMPDPGGHEHEEWVYGVDKRAAEDVLNHPPFTSLRLPMINSERDHHDRIYGYWLRMQDGGPILLPDGEGLPLRHVYGGDVVSAVLRLASGKIGLGRAYNVSQDETISIDAFLEKMAAILRVPLRVARLPREKLKSLLPACSPFSGEWMSVLDNRRSKEELGLKYTPLDTYLERLIAYHAAQPRREPAGYKQRAAELHLASF